MTGHDPLCPWDNDELPGRQQCECVLIARVRADERERIAQAIEADRDERRSEVDLTEYSGVRAWMRNVDLALCGGMSIAARIARQGGSDA